MHGVASYSRGQIAPKRLACVPGPELEPRFSSRSSKLISIKLASWWIASSVVINGRGTFMGDAGIATLLGACGVVDNRGGARSCLSHNRRASPAG
ncbi:hypothetical protein LINGRAHAP2_LOCUS33215 [Linum grandiflorum]